MFSLTSLMSLREYILSDVRQRQSAPHPLRGKRSKRNCWTELLSVIGISQLSVKAIISTLKEEESAESLTF